MGVLKWLRRERITLTSRRTISPSREDQHSQSDTNIGTIRTDEYKRDLAEFKARRSSGHQETEDFTPKKKCKHSLSGCTDCASDPDKTFNYEKKSASKYKKKRAQSYAEDVPNVQFLFQNQVFMPGNMFAQATYSEPYKPRRRRSEHTPKNFPAHKHIDFKEDSPPLFYKNNSLPFDVGNFVSSPSEEEVDGVDPRVSKSRSGSSGGSSKNDISSDRLLEVMSELRSFDQWADEQLKVQSASSSKIGTSKSDSSSDGLPVVSSSAVDVTVDKAGAWSRGSWGDMPVQVRRLPGVTVERARRHPEVEILRKCRHPNIILLMGLFPGGVNNEVHLICERCVGSLHDILHVQESVLSAQTAVQYACDLADALVYLRMRGYVHTALSSHAAGVTSRGAAKLADVRGCGRAGGARGARRVHPRTRYENIGVAEATGSEAGDCEPLLSARSSADGESVYCDVTLCSASPHYRWLAPEMFFDEEGQVRACERTTVYSLALVLWECCNSTIPWAELSYPELRQQHRRASSAGPGLAADGAYPGALLALLQDALRPRARRPRLAHFAARLRALKETLDNMEYIFIQNRLQHKKSDLSSVWGGPSDQNSPKREPRPQQQEPSDSDTESNAIYETLERPTYATVEKCFFSEDETDRLPSLYEKLRDKEYSSACSTPISKTRARIKYMGTPIALHRSDSTEYCSIMSPESRNFGKSYDGNNNSTKTSEKFSKSFTPQSYKPLHIKVPEFNLDSLKALPRNNSAGKSAYNFDIKNYSLPNTPIARSNKLRRNAWLSGDLAAERCETESVETRQKDDLHQVQSAPQTPAASTYSSTEKDTDVFSNKTYDEERSPESIENRDHFVTFRTSQQDSSLSADSRDRTHSWSFKTTERSPRRPGGHTASLVGAHTGGQPGGQAPDGGLTGVNVKPLVAIHEKWIYEANRKTCRAASLAEERGLHSLGPAPVGVKPASHLSAPAAPAYPAAGAARHKYYRPPLMIHPAQRNGGLSAQFCRARDNIARCLAPRHEPRHEHDAARPRENSFCSTPINEIPPAPPHLVAKVDQTTDTDSIEAFIREIIRKEIQNVLHNELGDHSDKTSKKDEIINKSVSNVMDALKNPEDSSSKVKFSRVKINGNNKPLIQITFARNGENNLQVLDNCVSVTFCDKGDRGKVNLSLEGRDKMNLSVESRDRLNVSLDEPADGSPQSLKRCQTFNALQEARSTEDLYIDDELSSQLQQSFGRAAAAAAPGHALHELLCERQDDCCLIKIKKENGYDSFYFRCDSDTEPRDAPDGGGVVYKRSISLIEERIERVVADKRPTNTPAKKPNSNRRTKSEAFPQNFNKETRKLSNSSPSLSRIDDEVELNIANVMSYDSSSDECLKCQADDDFETLERQIEEQVAKDGGTGLGSGLNKISEENLSVINEEESERDASDVDGTVYDDDY